MEGDVIRTIRNNINWIGHFRTGGVPGRHEINDSQELNYNAVASRWPTDYQGFVAQFVPTRNVKLHSGGLLRRVTKFRPGTALAAALGISLACHPPSHNPLWATRRPQNSGNRCPR